MQKNIPFINKPNILTREFKTGCLVTNLKQSAKQADLYFVSIVPPEPLYTLVKNLKEAVCQKFNSCASLNSPPHITLHMPFKWKPGKTGKLLSFFEDFKSDVAPFQLKVNGVSHFGERVIYLSVERNESLSTLQHHLARQMKRELNLFNAIYKDRAFHPHMTIAFRDLKKKHFQDALLFCGQEVITSTFAVKEISLLKHNGKVWSGLQNFTF